MLYKLTFALDVSLRDCPHLLPGNQCLGTGTKWFCIHTLSTRYVDVNIVTPSPPRSDAILKHELSTRGGGTPHMKGVGMLVVSLRGVNSGFWSHLGCSGQKAIIFSREGLV